METNDRCLFNNDPIYMKNLVGKSVTVITTENKIYNGTVYVIDPESKTVVIITKTKPKIGLDFITYDSIKSFDVTSSHVVNPELLFDTATPYENTEELHNKKFKLKEWLKNNHIDVQEEGSLLKLNNQVIIESPYGPEQCLCNNTIVLDRIRTLIAKMPDL